jgi:hypothetical protein
MTTRDFILLGTGAFVGYILVGVMNRNKALTAIETGTNLPDTSSQTAPLNCEAMWEEKSKMMKGSPEYLLKQKTAFLSFCAEGKTEFTKDFGNGLVVAYKNDCNKVTLKCPIIRVSLNGTNWTAVNGKYYRTSGGSANIDVRPIEITEKQWIEEAISKVPY